MTDTPAAETEKVSSKKQKLLLIIAIVIVVLSGAGIFSNEMSKDKCEKEVAQWIVTDVMRTKPFNVLEQYADTDTVELFNSVNAHYSVYAIPEDGPGLGRYPWAYVKQAKSAFPFIVSVDWKWVTKPLKSAESSRYYLCLFGSYIPLGDGTVIWDN